MRGRNTHKMHQYINFYEVEGVIREKYKKKKFFKNNEKLFEKYWVRFSQDLVWGHSKVSEELPFIKITLNSKSSDSVLHQYLLGVPESHTWRVHQEGGLLTAKSLTFETQLCQEMH